jgi:glycosyltransferase involved in cell wall biosynthesis
MHDLRITALIGCWNAAGTLRRGIDSLLSQTVHDLELLVVDDGSTDDTSELVRSIEDPRVRYMRLPHQGISRSLNAGVCEARAGIVAIQDADDYSLPNRLERQLALLDARPDVAVVGSRMREVDENGTDVRPRTSFAAGDVRRALLRFNPIPNTAAAFRRDAFLELGGYDTRYRYAMDYDLWLRMAERHVVFTLDEVLSVREMSGTNFGASNERPMTREVLTILTSTMRRRRTLRGATGLVLPGLSYVTPIPAKRTLRRVLGQAP